MKQKNLLMIIVSVLLAVLASIAFLNIAHIESDAIKFKIEYENLNGKETSYGTTYKKLTISEINPIKYSNYDEILDILKNKTGIIYFGFPECPWCRNAVPVLIDVAKDNNIENIYYLNIKNERDSYIVEDNKLVYTTDENGKEIKGTKGYFKLLDALDEYLNDYTIVYEDKTYEVGEKRLYAPTFVFVKDGKVVGLHVSTVESHTDSSKNLTKKQYNELYGIFEDFILEMEDNTCSSDTAC